MSWGLLSLQDPHTARSVTQSSKAMRVTDFELVEAIGAGGYGNVWLARRRRTEELVAIKVHSKSEAKARNFRQAVDLEKNILLASDNPYVVRFFFSFASRHHLYIVMEYMPGGDCGALLQSCGFTDRM